MKYQVTAEGGVATARIIGSLTFDHRSEAAALASALTDKGATKVVIDLSSVDYIDSAGLGILLTVHGKVHQAGATATLKGMAGSVKEVLDLACFDTLFAFEA